MSGFSKRLREEIEYKGILQKELAAKAGIKKRALDMYLGSRESMPPADVAVRLAKVLGVSVEYLVTGENNPSQPQRDFRHLEQDLTQLSNDMVYSIEALVHNIAKEKGSPES